MALVREVLLAARRALQGAGCDSPEIESDMLLAFTLGVSRSHLLAMRGSKLSADTERQFGALLARRAGREPLGHIIGGTEFYGRWFEVTPDVLIPRVDTETLVDVALAEVDQWGGEDRGVLELGVGSGCVICSILAERKFVSGHGVDVSVAALEVTRKNAQSCGVFGRLELGPSDWFTDVPDVLRGKIGLIVSNPPYIDPAEKPTLQPEVRDFEPEVALFAADRGFAAIATLLSEGHRWLRPGGLLLFEIGFGQAAECMSIARRFPYSEVRTHADTAGIARVLSARAASLA